MKISTNLKYLRKKNQLTQRELAEKIGKTAAAVSEYEKGKAAPPIEVALRICELFDISLDSLSREDVQKEEILRAEGLKNLVAEPKADYIVRYEACKRQNKTLERLNELLEQRVADLERQMRQNAPELARQLGLLDEDS